MASVWPTFERFGRHLLNNAEVFEQHVVPVVRVYWFVGRLRATTSPEPIPSQSEPSTLIVEQPGREWCRAPWQVGVVLKPHRCRFEVGRCMIHPFEPVPGFRHAVHDLSQRRTLRAIQELERSAARFDGACGLKRKWDNGCIVAKPDLDEIRLVKHNFEHEMVNNLVGSTE
jgi:hypothetical protein